MPVVVDHRVVVLGLPPPGLARRSPAWVGPEVHVGGVDPQEERDVVGVLALDEVDGALDDLVVDGLHPLLRQRPGVLDRLRAVGVGPARGARRAARSSP